MLIYKAENIIDGKMYIGQTIKTLEERKRRHLSEAQSGKGFKFQEAIRYWGADKFRWTILEEVDTIQQLNEREKYWIEYYKSYKNGYNLTKGDSNPMNFVESKQHHEEVMRSKEVREKISKTMKKRIAEGNFFTEEHRRKISEKLKGNKHFQGHKRTPEAIEASAKRRRKKVSCYDEKQNLVKKFDSLNDAVDWITINNIYPQIHNKTSYKGLIKRSYDKNKYYNGLIWKYD